MHEALPSGSTANWEGLVRLDTAGFLYRVDKESVTEVELRDTFAQAWFSTPLAAPQFDLLATAEEGCWPFPHLPAEPTYIDVGSEVSVGIGEHAIALARERDGANVSYWWYSEENPRSSFMREDGLSVSLGTEATGVALPPELVLTDPETVYGDYLDDGDFTLSWTAERDGGSVLTLTTYHRGELEDEYGWFCLLLDDGAAEIDFGNQASAFEQLILTRTHAAVLESLTYGRVHVRTVSTAQFSPEVP